MLFIKRGQNRCCSRNAAEFEKKSMSDNIRNKAIFEIKIAKIAQNLPKIDILQIWRCTMGMFLLTLQKNPVSLSFIVTEIWPGQNTNSKSGFFGQNFQNFWQNWILILCCTTSVGMLFLEIFAIFLHKGFLEIWLGQESVTDKRTDGRPHGRTDIHGGKNNICLPQGETYNYHSELCLWMRALNADWLTVTIAPCISHTYPQNRIHNKTIVTSQSMFCFTMYKTNFHQKCWWSPKRQKAPYRHQKHTPYAVPSRDDSYLIWTKSTKNCRLWKVLNKS